MSSHDVVSVVRRIFLTKKIGHAGTLDPAATGVLPVAIGASTRLLEYLEVADKRYRTEITLGYATDTGDVYGKLLQYSDKTNISQDRLLLTISKFRGLIRQIPTKYSAIKINGRRAYELARQGKAVTIPERLVIIHDINCIKFASNQAWLDVQCSKGTYIRTLVEDIGRELGCSAVISLLLRTGVGDFDISTSYSLEEVLELGSQAILPADKFLSHIPEYELRNDRVVAFCNGLSTSEYNLELQVGLYRVYCNKKFLGIAWYDANRREILPKKIFTT